MAKRTKLKVWMDENGFTHVSLAKELGFSYEYIYKIAMAKDNKWTTVNFQVEFIKRFGWMEAAKAFDVILPMPSTDAETAPA